MIDPTDRGWGHGGGPLHAAVIYDSEGSLQTRSWEDQNGQKRQR